MLDFLRDGHCVTSNIKINDYPNPELYHFVDFSTCDWWSLPVGAPRGSDDYFRSAIFIDEAAEFFDQFSYSSQYVKNFMSWLRQTSKQGQFVFLIVQNPDYLVRSARSLCHSWINVVDMRQYRIPVLRFRLPFCGDLILQRIFDRHGNLLSRGFIVSNKLRIGSHYETSQLINNVSHACNYKPPSFESRLCSLILRHSFRLFLFPFILVILILMLL